jgi:serine/threonine protein kinase
MQDFTDVYYVFEFMDTNLSQVIRSTQTLTDEHVQYIMYQILLGLQYLHSAGFYFYFF